MTQQLELPYTDPEVELLGLISRICVINGHQVVADALGISLSHLMHALARRKNAAVRAEKLWRLVQFEGGHDLIQFLAECRGEQIITDPPANPVEELRAVLDILDEELGPRTRMALKRAIPARVRRNRGLPKAGEGEG